MIKSIIIGTFSLFMLFISIGDEALGNCEAALNYCTTECGNVFSDPLLRLGCETGCAIGYLDCVLRQA